MTPGPQSTLGFWSLSLTPHSVHSSSVWTTRLRTTLTGTAYLRRTGCCCTPHRPCVDHSPALRMRTRKICSVPSAQGENICIRHMMSSSQHKSTHQARAFRRGPDVVTSAEISTSRRTQRCRMYFLVRITI